MVDNQGDRPDQKGMARRWFRNEMRRLWKLHSLSVHEPLESTDARHPELSTVTLQQSHPSILV